MPTTVLVGAEYEENLSLRYLAASVARDGFDAEIIPCNSGHDPDDVASRVLACGPDVVGISVPFQLRARELLSLSTRLRARGYTGHVCVGGHFATFEYRNILRDFPAVDSVIRHEGEDAFRWLCGRVRDGLPVTAEPGLVVRGPDGIDVGAARVLPPLDDLPFPDRRGAPRSVLGISVAPLVGSRGCYADCSFCCIYAYGDNANGPRYRRRSPESIVAEMRDLYHKRGVRLFVFHDDNFFMPTVKANLERYRRFEALLRDEGMTDIGLVIKARPNDVDPELFALLKSIGLVRAYVGVETNSDEGIVSLNRRITPEDNRRAMRILHDLDIFNTFNVLIFDPEATLDGVASNLDFLEAHRDIPFNFCRAEVYAGTPLKRMLEAENRLSGDYLNWGYRMRDPRVELLFRIMVLAFNRRNFDTDGVHNLNMGLRCDLEIVRRFYPDVWSRAMHDEAVSLSRDVGADSVAHMRRALAFCRTASPYDTDAVKRLSLDVTRAVAAADLRFVARMQTLRESIERELRAPGNRPGGPVWAAETRRLVSSSGRDVSTELLPTPAIESGGAR